MIHPGASAFELIMREGVDPKLVVGKKVPPPPEYSETRENGLRIERNLPVRLRDGVRIFVDVYRPEGAAGERNLPALLGWSPYGKHNTSARLAWPEAGVQDGWMSPYTAFEAPDPMYWCRHRYAIVYPDPRGSWYSEGELRHGGAFLPTTSCGSTPSRRISSNAPAPCEVVLMAKDGSGGSAKRASRRRCNGWCSNWNGPDR
jgi:hypothetical protein